MITKLEPHLELSHLQKQSAFRSQSVSSPSVQGSFVVGQLARIGNVWVPPRALPGTLLKCFMQGSWILAKKRNISGKAGMARKPLACPPEREPKARAVKLDAIPTAYQGNFIGPHFC